MDSIEKITLTDIIVETLGMMVPGALVMFSFAVTILLPLYFAAAQFSSEAVTKALQMNGSLTFLQSGLLGICLLIIAFVSGTLFFRLSPKTVDQLSAAQLSETDLTDGAVTRDCVKGSHVEFPYRFLRSYFSNRGLDYLAQHIPWDGNEANGRTKHFANALKIRIQIAAPDAYQLLAKNEAHVRLSSSLWYACGVIVEMAILGIIITIALFIALLNMNTAALGPPIAALGICVCMLGLAQVFRSAIVKSFHYQRVREISQILETAHWLQSEGTVPRIFEGLSADN